MAVPFFSVFCYLAMSIIAKIGAALQLFNQYFRKIIPNNLKFKCETKVNKSETELLHKI